MGLKEPNWNDCTKKCRCGECCGPNKGKVYECDSPCSGNESCSGWTISFDSAKCDCDYDLKTTSGNWFFTGTLEDITNPACLTAVSGTVEPMTPDARWGGGCKAGSTPEKCLFTMGVGVPAPSIDPATGKVIYYAPGIADFSLGGGEVDNTVSNCCFGIGNPFPTECTLIRKNMGNFCGTSDSVVGRPRVDRYARSDDGTSMNYFSLGFYTGFKLLVANAAYCPMTTNYDPNQATNCAGTGWSVKGEWTFNPD